MVASFTQDTAVRRAADGMLSATLSEDWAIWGPNGGYIASIALRAAGLIAPAGHRPATFSCQYLTAAAFADIEITVDPVRQGRSAWCLNVRLIQNGKTFLQAQVWTTDRDSGPTAHAAAPPAVPPPGSLKDFRELAPDQPVHPFWQHFDSRPVRYLPPGAVNPDGPHMRGWYRLHDVENTEQDPFLDAARAVLLLDTMPWPTFWRAQPESPTYIAPSLDLSVWLHQGAFDSDWLLADIHADTAQGGLIHGGGRIWTPDGSLIATGASQLLVVERR